MARRVEFTLDYNHRWPSRAMTAFKAGMKLLVKEEVAATAIARGRAIEVAKSVEAGGNIGYVPADASKAPPADDERPDGVAQSDDADDVGPKLRVRRNASTTKRQRT